VSTLISSNLESEEEVYHDHSSATSSWDSDVSVGAIFKSLSVNMVSASHLDNEDEDTVEYEEMIQSDTDPWIKLLNTFWDIYFEQHEPPTEYKVTQINLGDEVNPKPIFIGQILSPSMKKDLIHLIQEYINVFA